MHVDTHVVFTLKTKQNKKQKKQKQNKCRYQNSSAHFHLILFASWCKLDICAILC